MPRQVNHKPISTVSSVLIRLDPSTRRVIKVGGSPHQRLSYLVYGPDRAIAELKAGRDCYLDNFPGNIEKVRAGFMPTAQPATEVPNAQT